jgi:hypothetical protein
VSDGRPLGILEEPPLGTAGLIRHDVIALPGPATWRRSNLVLDGDRAGTGTPAWGATWSTCHPLKSLRRERGMPSVDVRASGTDRNYRHARACVRAVCNANLRNLAFEILIRIMRSRSLVITPVKLALPLIYPELFSRISFLSLVDDSKRSTSASLVKIRKCREKSWMAIRVRE